MAVERIQIDYDFLVTYFNTILNVSGATTNTTLRTITAHNDGNSIYVRKFGLDYEITDCDGLEDPVDVNMKFLLYANDGTLLGSRIGGAVFVDSGLTVSAQGCYLEIEASGGAVVVLATIDIGTDVDPIGGGGKTFICAAETIADGDTLRLYLSDTTSTYYDSGYKYGGARHVPDSTSGLPYFDITTAIADPDATGFTITTVLDSESYDEIFSISIAGMILQTALGQTATVTSGVGARATREVENDGNNTDTKYVSKIGNDANPGTYQEPYLTIQFAENNMGGLSILQIMDSETYEEALVIDSAISIEPIYAILPIIKPPSAGTTLIDLTDTAANLYGLTIDGDNIRFSLVDINVDAYTGTIKNNTIINSDKTLSGATGGIHSDNTNFAGVISFNNIHDCANGIDFVGNANTAGTIDSCIIHDNALDGLTINHAAGGNITGTISNCLSYNNTNAGIQATCLNGDLDATIENNTSYNNGLYGLWCVGDTFGGTIRNNIMWGNGTFDLYRNLGAAITITESLYGTNSGFTLGAGVIQTDDPKFCKITNPLKLGISADSEGYRSDTSSDDMGAHFRIIELNESTIEINGFNIDGQGQYNNAVYILDSVDHITNSLKWCSVYDFQGIAIDPYDDDSDTVVSISNCIIRDNGNGIKFSYGGNTVEESLIYNNSVFSIHSNWTGNTFNHNSFYNNQYALYFELNSATPTIKNNIFHSNSLYGIFSEASIVVTYCDISDSPLTANVDASDSSNITSNPLFQDLLVGSENFNLQTIEAGFTANSLAKETADDGQDMGAYDVSRGITDLGWKKYVLDVNPDTADLRFMSEGFRQDRDALGSPSTWEKNVKIVIPLAWSDNQVTTKQQWNKIKYFASLRSSRQLGKNKQTTLMRYDAEPSVHKDSGANATVTASTKILQDATKTWDENEFRGYNAAVIFTSGVGMVIDAGALTGTKAGAGWVVDEHTGRFLKYNGYTYYIKSNSATVLALSDPYSTLISAAIDYSIEKYFEINEMYNTEIILIDDNSELVDGTYNYYISFINARTLNSSFQFRQPGHDPTMEEWKTGYNLTLIQD